MNQEERTSNRQTVDLLAKNSWRATCRYPFAALKLESRVTTLQYIYRAKGIAISCEPSSGFRSANKAHLIVSLTLGHMSQPVISMASAQYCMLVRRAASITNSQPLPKTASSKTAALNFHLRMPRAYCRRISRDTHPLYPLPPFLVPRNANPLRT